MSKSILIIEKDVLLMKSMATTLSQRGFAVTESTDGKNAAENTRRLRPELVVLAVDLEAGQNGYIICKKLKSDDELKSIPVLITGDPKGFAQHQKLKTRAEDYLGKPLSLDSLLERAGALIGFPEGSPADDFAEEIEIESSPGDPLPAAGADSGIALIDSVFSALGGDADDQDQSEKTMIGMAPFGTASNDKLIIESKPPFSSSPSMSEERRFTSSVSDDRRTDDRVLRAKVTELTASLQDARDQVGDLEGRLRSLEDSLEAKSTELEAAKNSVSKNDSKDLFALKDAATKKDKEILRLKNELNAKETEILELKEKENTLEQQSSDTSGEMARKDAQLKSLQTKVEQLQAERRKIDQQLVQTREEHRAASASLSTLQSDFDAVQGALTELDETRVRLQDIEIAHQRVESELSEARGENEALKSQLEVTQSESDEIRSHLEQSQFDLDAHRNQLTTQANTFSDEMSSLRQKIADAEEEAKRHENRAEKAHSKVKGRQAQLASLRHRLESALAELDDSNTDAEEIEIDELAEA
jgi:chromosome segregation ATPase